MAEWQTVRLGTIVSTNQNTYSPKEDWQFVNYLDTGNITMNRVDEIQCINTLTDKLPSRARRKVKSNSIIYSTVRPNQLHYGIIKEQPENFLVSTGFAVIDVDFEKAVPDYIYYALTQQEVTEHLQAIAEQSVSAYPSIKPSDIENLELLLPDKNTQRKIVAILRSIDEKIKQNNEINNNLEQQAQALVNEYCSSTNSEVVLGSIMNFVNGFAFQSKSYQKNGKYQIITIKNVQDGKIDSQGAAYINEVPTKMKAECYLQVGDILLSLTGNVGRVGIVFEENLLLNQRVAKFTSSKDVLPLLYFYFRFPETKTSLETIAKGTAQQNLSPIETLKLNFPYDENKAIILSRDLKPMFDSIVANNIESSKLEQIRDCLLPKLMSGELDVSDIDL